MYKVLTPIKVGPMELKNRVMLLAMAKSIGNPDNTLNDRQISYYENFAKGGVGLLTTGACILFPEYPSTLPCQPGVYDDKFIPELKKLVDVVHKYGTKIVFQPWHPGITPYGCDPSVLKSVTDFTLDEIHEHQKRFLEAAVRIQKAGADGVEVHAAHNYLLEQFLTPLFNKRTDEYGAQNMENGLRFTTEIIQSIKNTCGPDFAVTVKINGNDFNPDGMNEERLAQVGPILEKAGADMISVSAGGSLTDITGMSDNGSRPEGWKVPLAEIVKKSGISIPVMATGSIRHPEYVEQILTEGKCDMIGMGRGLVAEPEWVNKLAEGREDEMASCISCMGCFNYPVPGESGCSVNPTCLREYQNIEVKKDGEGKTAVVVGGGPGGMQAAKTLAERGFSVVLFEKDSKLGGLENLAAAPFGKSKIKWHIDYLTKQLERLNVDVRLGKEVTAEEIKAMKPYGVVMATGTIPTYPKFIPGIDKAHVIESRDLLRDIPEVTGENVVVIGTGLVGLETAMTFAVKGNKVSVLDMIALDMTKLTIEGQLGWGGVMAMGAGVYMEHKLLEITDEAVIAENMQTGEKVTIPADRVILCMGRKANNKLYEELTGQIEHLYNVGDSNNPDKIKPAVQGGFDAAVAM